MKMHPPYRPNSSHDSRVDKPSRRLKTVLVHFQRQSEVHVLVELLEECIRSSNVFEDTIKVVELRPRYSNSKHIHTNPMRKPLGLQGLVGEGKKKIAVPEGKVRRQGGTDPAPVKAAPPTARSKEAKELKEECERKKRKRSTDAARRAR